VLFSSVVKFAWYQLALGLWCLCIGNVRRLNGQLFNLKLDFVAVRWSRWHVCICWRLSRFPRCYYPTSW